jgi:hypothetical protein
MTDICAICRESLEDPEQEIYETKCGHKFHKDCLISYCKNINKNEDVNFSFISCPLCNRQLNCRIEGGDDIFPEKIHSKENIDTNIYNVSPIDTIGMPKIIQQALNIIPEEEYDMITTPDDIVLDNLDLTSTDKQKIFQLIDKYNKQKKQEGGRKKSRKTISRRRRKNNNKKLRTKKLKTKKLKTKKYHKR